MRAPDERLAWISSIPYILMHVGVVVGVFFIPPTWDTVLLAVGLYYLRMFGITAGYHRYFAHRGFKTGRIFQFVLAFLGSMSVQKGVLWWSGLHRHHHKFSDMPEDIHSPKRGFWWSHHGWFLCKKYDETPPAQLEEFAAYPEIIWLNRYWLVAPLAMTLVLFLFGGGPWLFYGGLVSTVVLYHGTFTINSLAHEWGSRRYETTDTSRNNFWLALLTMGEGWHNNHHHYQSTARNGFFWWEVDLSYYILKVLSWFGIVWNLRQPPKWLLEGKERRHQARGAPVAEPAFSLPASLVETAQALRRLREEARAEHADHQLRARLAELAASLAEHAAEAARSAQLAAERAQAGAAETKARLIHSAAEAAARAAAFAREAEEAAAEAARALESRVCEAMVSAAAAAARAADAAAERAHAMRAELGTSPLAA